MCPEVSVEVSAHLVPWIVSYSQEKLGDVNEKCGDYWRDSHRSEKCQSGQSRLATQSVSSVRRTLTRSYDESNGETPPRVPGGGGMSWLTLKASDPGNERMTMSKQCACGKMGKNESGFKIHKARGKGLVWAGAGVTPQCLEPPSAAVWPPPCWCWQSYGGNRERRGGWKVPSNVIHHSQHCSLIGGAERLLKALF